MKRIIIGSLVGGLIFFIVQAGLWMSGFHDDISSYTPNQENIINALSQNLDADGLYFIPSPDPSKNLSHQEEEMLWEQNMGKPWAMIFYHKSWVGMGSTMLIKGFLYALIACFITSLVMYHGQFLSFMTRFLVAMSFSIYTIVQSVLDNMNWWSYPWNFVKAEIIDMIFAWGICAIFLAWYVKKKYPVIN